MKDERCRREALQLAGLSETQARHFSIFMRRCIIWAAMAGRSFRGRWTAAGSSN
ncbi:hypothetical protein PO124_16345 [Bacillus licheniformis]|nr:hypothetical protein [Bacillus licheniformis]